MSYFVQIYECQRASVYFSIGTFLTVIRTVAGLLTFLTAYFLQSYLYVHWLKFINKLGNFSDQVLRTAAGHEDHAGRVLRG